MLADWHAHGHLPMRHWRLLHAVTAHVHLLRWHHPGLLILRVSAHLVERHTRLVHDLTWHHPGMLHLRVLHRIRVVYRILLHLHLWSGEVGLFLFLIHF